MKKNRMLVLLFSLIMVSSILLSACGAPAPAEEAPVAEAPIAEGSPAAEELAAEGSPAAEELAAEEAPVVAFLWGLPQFENGVWAEVEREGIVDQYFFDWTVNVFNFENLEEGGIITVHVPKGASVVFNHNLPSGTIAYNGNECEITTEEECLLGDAYLSTFTVSIDDGVDGSGSSLIFSDINTYRMFLHDTRAGQFAVTLGENGVILPIAYCQSFNSVEDDVFGAEIDSGEMHLPVAMGDVFAADGGYCNVLVPEGYTASIFSIQGEMTRNGYDWCDLSYDEVTDCFGTTTFGPGVFTLQYDTSPETIGFRIEFLQE